MAAAKSPEEKELQSNLEVADAPREDKARCDNHPGRKARNFTGNGAFSVNLCDECTPEWFRDEDSAQAL